MATLTDQHSSAVPISRFQIRFLQWVWAGLSASGSEKCTQLQSSVTLSSHLFLELRKIGSDSDWSGSVASNVARWRIQRKICNKAIRKDPDKAKRGATLPLEKFQKLCRPKALHLQTKRAHVTACGISVRLGQEDEPQIHHSTCTDHFSSRLNLNQIHTADADATQLSSWVASASAMCAGH